MPLRKIKSRKRITCGDSWDTPRAEFDSSGMTVVSPTVWDIDFGFRLKQSANESRVLCGGSWRYYPRYLRSATRDDCSPSYRYNFVGFRLVQRGTA